MFHSARITLTAWYLVIIMTISIVFSLGFYNIATQEYQRIIRIQEFRQEHPGVDVLRPRAFIIQRPNIEALAEADSRLKFYLFVLNGVIFVVTGAAGYFLAGRTLRPIQEIMNEQHRFVTDASHELRTPLTSLRSEIEVALRNNELTLTEARRLLESNLEDVVSIQSLSDNLLALTRAGEKPKRTMMIDVSLAEALESAIRRLNGSIKKKQITLEKDVDDVHVFAFPEKIPELFTLMLDNGIKYSPKKSTIKIRATEQNEMVIISVEDDGIGISPEDLPYVFDRFYRGTKSRSKDAVPGYGLGLSIAKQIVSSHRGTIDVESSIGKGTTFTIQLPAK